MSKLRSDFFWHVSIRSQCIARAPGGKEMAETLDVAERRGGGPTWHHRVLLVAMGRGRWVCVTPRCRVQSDDLSVLTDSRGLWVMSRFYARY